MSTKMERTVGSTSRTSAEVEADYKIAMGEDLGTVFFALYNKLIELHIVWQQYRQLYGTDRETVKLLNETAGLFFKIVQNELWDSVLLGVSRMTDPPATGKRRNVTVQSLPELVSEPSVRAEVEVLCQAALVHGSFARDHRNKRIAHQDHGYLTDRISNPLSGISRERVEAMLTALREVMNRVDLHFRDSTVMYESFAQARMDPLLQGSAPTSIDELIHRLPKVEVPHFSNCRPEPFRGHNTCTKSN